VRERLEKPTGAATATQFPELNELLVRFVDRIRLILDRNLVGVYLTGSFALGSGDAASDCDFLAVTTGPLTRGHEHALRQLHEELPTWPSYWAYNLEGSYAPRFDLETLVGIGHTWLYVNRGGREMEWSTHCNSEDVRWVLREKPLILHGIDPRAFAAVIPATALQGQMRPQIENFLEDLLTWTTFEISWTQRYAVEAGVRMLYTLERGEVISKQTALDWATEAMPARWHALIEQVRRDHLVPWNDSPRPGSVERTLAFVEYVQERASRGDDGFR